MATVTILRLARCGQQCPLAASTVFIQKRNKSNTTLVNYKRGRGGRSSFSGMVATVFGNSGFVGRILVNRLGKMGSQVVIPYRGDPEEVAPLKLCGDLGQILFQPFQLNDEEAIRKSIMYSNIVINLVGSDHQTKNWSMKEVHCDGPRRIAKLCREFGVDRFIHFSALNASPNPQKIYFKEGSEFLKTKYAGEVAVREEYPDATIFRPSDIFGNDDRFMNYYIQSIRRLGLGIRAVPIWQKGNMTVKQPVYVSDVVDGILNALKDPDTAGKTYECIGPTAYFLSDLVDYFYRNMRESKYRITDIGFLFMIKTSLMKYNIGTPEYTWDRIERDMVTDRLTGDLTLEDLGITRLTTIEERAPFVFKPFRMKHYYTEMLGEYETPPPPSAASVQ